MNKVRKKQSRKGKRAHVNWCRLCEKHTINEMRGKKYTIGSTMSIRGSPIGVVIGTAGASVLVAMSATGESVWCQKKHLD